MSVRLSVIVPLADHRGLALRSLDAWAGQTLHAACYEVVAATDGRGDGLPCEIERALRPQDRLLLVPGADEIRLYQAGADAARGDVLLFTEAHCVPDGDVAEAVVRFFSEEDAAAGCLEARHLSRGVLARLEERMARETRAGRAAAGRWSEVSLRGFAIRADVFRRLGGFRTELERFAETALAVELERGGYPICPIPNALVSHGDCASIRELEPALLALGRGRRSFRNASPLEDVDRFVGPNDVDGAALEPRLARALCRVLLRALATVRGQGLARPLLRRLGSILPAALAGGRGTLVADRVAARIALWRTLLPGSQMETRFSVYSAAYYRLVRCGELERLLGEPPPRLAPPDVEAPCFEPGRMPDAHFVGFHAREEDARGSFRWSSPVGLVRLAVARGTYDVRLAVENPRGDRGLALFWNGRRVTCQGRDELAFHLRPSDFRAGGEQHLAAVCAPFVPREAGLKDRRALGLAFRRIGFVPLAPSPPRAPLALRGTTAWRSSSQSRAGCRSSRS